MPYSKSAIEKLYENLALVEERKNSLRFRFLGYDFQDEASNEYAIQGFTRRLSLLTRCIHNIFDTIPPECQRLPERKDLLDVAINLQSFVFNVFGSVDNLAWVVVFERNILNSDGTKIKRGWVGLRKKNKFIRRKVSPKFNTYLKSRDKWFEYQEEFRDALAHRIPLYVPPGAVIPKNEGEYNDLEEKLGQKYSEMSGVTNNHEKFWKLSSERKELENKQRELMFFNPIMAHSISENSRPVMFHAQVLADFKTVVELGEEVLDEIKLPLTL